MHRAKWSVRAVVVLGIVGAVLVPARPAAANVGISASLQMPGGRAVGATAQPGSFTVRNTNTAPQNGDSNMVVTLRLVPSCGTTSTSSNLCSSPDPGVFSISPTATGAGGTACAGRVFDVSAPDGIGAVTFTPRGGAVVLPPPNGVAGANECRVDFTVGVLRVPSVDADPAPGVQTRANLLAQTRHPSGAVLSSRPTVLLTVVKGSPTMFTRASRNSAAGTITAFADVSGVAGAAAPTGTVTFTQYAPTDTSCTGTVLGTSTSPVSAGTATSSAFPAPAAGSYRFVITYSGDANYGVFTRTCHVPTEAVVPAREAVADFNGNGTTDVSVFRPSTGTWYVLTPPSAVTWGSPGDIPVPGDYDGNGTTEHAVYRPSTGVWYLLGPNPTVRSWGVPGDVPVPADYDGNGTTDLAVFRPSNGVWYLHSSGAAIEWGQNGDVPVPGDYDRDGRADIAIYRPTNGMWHVRTSIPTATQWGIGGDVPVPGDYNGNGSTDIAVFRPSTGVWYIHSPFSAQAWGSPGDVPAPGDYDGNGTTDRAVYRPSTATWYVLTPSPYATTWGGAGDIPLPLPQAIYRAYF